MRRLLVILALLIALPGSSAQAQFSGGGGGPTQAAPLSAVEIGNNALNVANAAYAQRDFATAAAQYAAGCDAGNATACGKLGEMFVRGEGVKANSARAAGPLAKACDGGVAAACQSLGELYAVGNGLPTNKVKALALYDKACGTGVKVACDLARQARTPPVTTSPPQTLTSETTDLPATALQSRLLASAIKQDSYSWVVNKYDNGSLRNVRITESNKGLVTVRGDYTYNQGEIGHVYAQIRGPQLECIQYWDTNACVPVRKLPYYITNPREDIDCYIISEIRSPRTYSYTLVPGDGHWSGGYVIAREIVNNCRKSIFIRNDTSGELKRIVKPGETGSIGLSDIVRFK